MNGGLLLVDKPTGITSHDAVLALRRILPKGTKVGHTGTLDPMANGLLILLVGPATKAAAGYQRLPKVYAGRIRLGLATDSGDMDGKLVRESLVPELDAAFVRRALESFVGAIEMPPPAYSAVKYKGRPLYAWARAGVTVPLKNRACEIYSWELLGWASPDIEFRLHCSHGTYARSLAIALGDKLGCAAVLHALRRERIGGHRIEDAMSVAEMAQAAPSAIEGRLKPA